MKTDNNPDDAQLYLTATKEVDGDSQDEALWSKSLALSEGEAERARYMYIQLRVSQLSEHVAKTTEEQNWEQRSPSMQSGKIVSKPLLGRALCPEKDQAIIQAIRDGERRGRKSEGVWYMSDENENAGYESRSSSNASLQAGGHQSSHTNDPEGFLSKLVNGNLGLAKTYWLFGVVFGLLARLLLGVITDEALMVVFTFVCVVYQIAVLIGIWRAATKYKGPKYWAVLAKLAAVFGGLQIGVLLLSLAAI